VNKAVFLSYAREDSDAARRIAEALRAAGVEVWFDQSELRGGDAWDRKIRTQIKECALFVPVISEGRVQGVNALPFTLTRGAWKVAAAAYLKETTDVSNGWLARQLDMGSHFFVSKHVEAAGRGLALGFEVRSFAPFPRPHARFRR